MPNPRVWHRTPDGDSSFDMTTYHKYSIEPLESRYRSDDAFFGDAHLDAACIVCLHSLTFAVCPVHKLPRPTSSQLDVDNTHRANWLRVLHRFL